MHNQSRTIFAIGECMVEFARSEDGSYRRSFAGDVFNTAVYLKRLAPADCTVEFVSAVGEDEMSKAMMAAWQSEGIATNHVAKIPAKSPGLYVIETDEDGERRFAYWRNQSAARELSKAIKRMDLGTMQAGDAIYYSGITLAILTQDCRNLLFDFVKEAKSKGVTIAFDPNFRPALWETHAAAAETTMNAYGLADIVLTGADEEASLFGWGSEVSELVELERIGVKEVILKSGERGVFGSDGGARFHVPFTPADKVVDTTAAGDSFAGAYLAFRLRGKSPKDAVKLAAKVAGIVVCARGAIIPQTLFEQKIRADSSLSEDIDHAHQ